MGAYQILTLIVEELGSGVVLHPDPLPPAILGLGTRLGRGRLGFNIQPTRTKITAGLILVVLMDTIRCVEHLFVVMKQIICV